MFMHREKGRDVKQSVVLPWPPKGTSPNVRHSHWSKRASATRGYRLACMWTAAEQKIKPMRAGKVKARITFHAPDKRPRDIDNMLASIKAAIDAVAKTIEVDDSKWSLVLERGMPKPKLGEVVIELEEA